MSGTRALCSPGRLAVVVGCYPGTGGIADVDHAPGGGSRAAGVAADCPPECVTELVAVTVTACPAWSRRRMTRCQRLSCWLKARCEYGLGTVVVAGYAGELPGAARRPLFAH